MPNDNGMYTIKILSNIGPFHSLVIDFFRIIPLKTSYFIAENDSIIYFKHNSKKLQYIILGSTLFQLHSRFKQKNRKGNQGMLFETFFQAILLEVQEISLLETA